jgi:hypothetical protein
MHHESYPVECTNSKTGLSAEGMSISLFAATRLCQLKEQSAELTSPQIQLLHGCADECTVPVAPTPQESSRLRSAQTNSGRSMMKLGRAVPDLRRMPPTEAACAC